MLLDLVQGIEWLSGLFVRCTIQKGKEWSANDSSPYHKPHECGFKKSGVRQKGRGVWSHISVYTASRTWARLWSTILYIVAAQGGGTVKICLCRNGSIRLTKIWTVCVNWEWAHIYDIQRIWSCAKVGGSGAIPPVLSNYTSPQILIDTVKVVTINIVTSPGYDRANVKARFKGEIWVMHRKLRVVAVIWQFRIQGAPDRERGWTAPWWAMQLSKSHPGPLRPFGVGLADGGA